MKAFPGGPFDDEVQLNPEIQAVLISTYGLDQPIHTQYFKYMTEFFKGNMGVSLYYPGQSVKKLIIDFSGVSLALGSIAFVFSVAVSFLLAVGSFVSSTANRSVNLITLLFVSIPSLLLGPLLIYLFGFYFDILPVALLEKPSAYILPILILSIKPIANLTRVLKSSLEESLLSDDIKTLRAYGFSDSVILLKWALRKSLLPFLSQIPSSFAGLLAGSVLVEILFAIPGLGTQYVEALLNRDIALVVGLTLAYGVVLILAQALVDWITAVIDPRMKAA